MKKLLFAPLIMLAIALPAQAAQSPDQLLVEIKADIEAKRLSSPAGNNALEKIKKFRQEAPFDFRISAVAYDWGAAYVELANQAIEQKDYAKAQGYLDIVWPVASLTPGLESTQEEIDKNFKGKAKPATSAPSAQELERQRKAAAEAAAEKARVAAEQKRQQEEQLRQEALAKKQAAEEQAKRQQLEKERRLAAEKAAAAKSAESVAKAPEPVVKPEPKPESVAAPVVISKPKSAPAPVVVPVVTRTSNVSNERVSQLWATAEEESAPIASYPLDQNLLDERDREGMAKALVPVCKAILDNDASVVVHSKDKTEYRWLTVRLTLCLRQEDRSFRLRHSYKDDAQEGEAYITLHPMRDVSLIKQVHDGY